MNVDRELTGFQLVLRENRPREEEDDDECAYQQSMNPFHPLRYCKAHSRTSRAMSERRSRHPVSARYGSAKTTTWLPATIATYCFPFFA